MTFEFIADRPVLDFVATVGERDTTYADRLTGPDALADWVAAAGLAGDAVAVDAAGFAHAVALREAMFRLIRALIDGTPTAAADRDLVNDAAAAPRPRARLTRTGAVVRDGDLSAVLSLLAADCVGLFDGPDRGLLHWCADPVCTRPFIDRSRGHRRRWCDMASCGDRAKAAAYRRRRRVPTT